MGLDSVELLVETEKFFKINIPDNEAEEILTVQDFSDCVRKHIVIQNNNFNIAATIFYKIRQHLVQHFNFPKNAISPNSNLGDTFVIENRAEIWTSLQKHLQLELPSLTKNDLTAKKIQKRVNFLGFRIENLFSNKPILDESSFANLVDWIVSINFRKLIEPSKLHNDYEIQRAIIGIITEKMGIEVQSIELKHRIVHDLGID